MIDSALSTTLKRWNKIRQEVFCSKPTCTVSILTATSGPMDTDEITEDRHYTKKKEGRNKMFLLSHKHSRNDRSPCFHTLAHCGSLANVQWGFVVSTA